MSDLPRVAIRQHLATLPVSAGVRYLEKLSADLRRYAAQLATGQPVQDWPISASPVSPTESTKSSEGKPLAQPAGGEITYGDHDSLIFTAPVAQQPIPKEEQPATVADESPEEETFSMAAAEKYTGWSSTKTSDLTPEEVLPGSANASTAGQARKLNSYDLDTVVKLLLQHEKHIRKSGGIQPPDASSDSLGRVMEFTGGHSLFTRSASTTEPTCTRACCVRPSGSSFYDSVPTDGEAGRRLKTFMQSSFGHLLPEAQHLNALAELLSSEAKRQNFSLLWENRAAMQHSEQPDSEVYSMFPLTDEVAWHYACQQEVQLWSAKELDYPKDKARFSSMSPRYQQLYCDLLGFFLPGDGLVSQNVLRFIQDATNYQEQMFLIIQLYIEMVHSEGYGMSAVAVIPDEEVRKKVFAMINVLGPVKRKAAFVKKYIEGAQSRGERYVGAAISELVFFVALFAIVFLMRADGEAMVFALLNEQVSKDETLHGHYACDRAKEYGLPSRERVMEMLTEGLEIEMEHVRYILREPLKSVEEDRAMGATLENFELYVRLLCDQILVFLDLPTAFGGKCVLPWMGDISLAKKTNFYEGKVVTYKKMALQHALDWQGRAGVTEAKKEVNAAAAPEDVDF